MPLYEHTFLARQDVTQQQVTGLMNTYKAVIEEPGEVDQEGRELISQMLQPGLSQDEWAKLARDFHRFFNAWVRTQFEPHGAPEEKQYRFLKKTWNAVRF